MKKSLTIGELARLAGIHTSAIRYYESIDLLPPPPRASGQRRYEPGSIERLRAIRQARALGFTLGEIRVLLDGFDEGTPPFARWQRIAKQKLPQIEEAITRLTEMKRLLEAGTTCACPTVEDCLGHAQNASEAPV